MNILHLVSYPLYSGPVPGTLRLALAQRALGHTVWLALDSRRGNFDGFEEAASSHVSGLDLAPPQPLQLCTKGGLASVVSDWRRLRQLLVPGAVDVVHCHQSHDHALTSLCAAAGVRRVRTVHAARTLRRPLALKLLRHRTDAWVVRCVADARALRAHLAGRRAPPRVALIAGAADVAPFTPADARAQAAARAALGLPPAAVVIGHVALMAGRGQEELLHALARLPARLHALLVGRGSHEAALRAQAQALGLAGRVHFAGYLQQERLPAAYAAMDAAFVAQPGNDASARAALEAMAAGLPVFGVRTGALADWLTDSLGYPLPARHITALVAGLQPWLHDLDEGRRRGARARAHAQARSIEGEAEATLALYASVA